jgi:hypothetical protein
VIVAAFANFSEKNASDNGYFCLQNGHSIYTYIYCQPQSILQRQIFVRNDHAMYICTHICICIVTQAVHILQRQFFLSKMTTVSVPRHKAISVLSS